MIDPMTYYAHCMTLYGTAQEKRDIELISSLGHQVLDPSTHTESDMEYYLNLVKNCDMLAFRSNPDGAISSGVLMEVKFALAEGKPVFELPSNILRRGLTKEQTIEYLRESGQR